MVVDWHSHIWLRDHLGPHWGAGMDRRRVPDEDPPSVTGTPDHHRQQMDAAGVDCAIALAVTSAHIGMHVPNDFVAEYAHANDRIVGVGSVDPNSHDRVSEVKRIARLGLQGIKLSPPYQAFHPHCDEAFEVYRAAMDEGLFLIFHQGTVFTPTGPLEVAQPMLLDKVARSFPALRIIVAHVGQPWTFETVALMAKHKNVYADVSARINRPWQLFNILAAAADYGVDQKLLWGSDFPTFTMSDSLAGLRAFSDQYGDPRFIPPELPEALASERPLSLLGLAPGVRV